MPARCQVAFEKQQDEIAALNRAQEKAEARVSSIHHQLSASEAELSVLEAEMTEARVYRTNSLGIHLHFACSAPFSSLVAWIVVILCAHVSCAASFPSRSASGEG